MTQDSDKFSCMKNPSTNLKDYQKQIWQGADPLFELETCIKKKDSLEKVVGKEMIYRDNLQKKVAGYSQLIQEEMSSKCPVKKVAEVYEHWKTMGEQELAFVSSFIAKGEEKVKDLKIYEELQGGASMFQDYFNKLVDAFRSEKAEKQSLENKYYTKLAADIKNTLGLDEPKEKNFSDSIHSLMLYLYQSNNDKIRKACPDAYPCASSSIDETIDLKTDDKAVDFDASIKEMLNGSEITRDDIFRGKYSGAEISEAVAKYSREITILNNIVKASEISQTPIYIGKQIAEYQNKKDRFEGLKKFYDECVQFNKFVKDYNANKTYFTRMEEDFSKELDKIKIAKDLKLKDNGIYSNMENYVQAFGESPVLKEI